MRIENEQPMAKGEASSGFDELTAADLLGLIWRYGTTFQSENKMQMSCHSHIIP